jgi:hypothetical protein
MMAFCGTELKSIVIPSSVVVLGQASFWGCKALKVVIFEKGCRLERIGEMVFAWSGIESIAVPSTVVELGTLCFCECKSLQSIVFESDSRLERIEDRALQQSGLKSIVIPPNVTFIDGSALAGIAFNSISLSPDNAAFRIVDSFLEDVCGSILVRYVGVSRSVIIPSSVVVLGKSCFAWCKSLESVIFESGSRLERIESYAFASSGLKSIVIPSSVTVLGKSSFSWCESLDSVILENGSRLERIEEDAFSRTRLKSIVIPPEATFIDKDRCRGFSVIIGDTGVELPRPSDRYTRTFSSYRP